MRTTIIEVVRDEITRRCIIKARPVELTTLVYVTFGRGETELLKKLNMASVYTGSRMMNSVELILFSDCNIDTLETKDTG